LTLKGRTVVVTRDETADGALSRALAAFGARIVNLPLVQTVPGHVGDELAAAIQDLGPGDWVLLTSARAVAALPSVGFPARVAAVGPATAAAWTDRSGRQADVVGDGGGTRLAERLAADPAIRGATVIWPASSLAGHATVAALAEAGARVGTFVAYRVVGRPEGEAELASLLRDAPPDAVALASPSAVEGLVRALVGVSGAPPVLAAIGATTAAAVRAAGLPEPVVPAEPGFDALATALADRFARTP